MGVLKAVYLRLRSCPDSEGEQALLRVFLVSGIFLYLWDAGVFHSASGEVAQKFNLGFTIGIVVFSWLVVAWVVVSPRAVVSRRVSVTFVDVLATVYGVHATAENGAPLYAVLMWIILGTGVRFGVKYLYLASVLGAGGFYVILRQTDYWTEMSTLGWGLFLGLVGIPTYGSLLLRRLEESKKKSEEANAAKGRFLASMSHEVRTPLNGVIGMSEILLSSPLTPQQAQQVAAIRGSGHALLGIVDEILEFSKLEAGKSTVRRAPVRVSAIVDQVLAQFSAVSDGHTLEVISDVAASAPEWAVTDELHVRQALTNLVSNAIKFTEKGKVEVRVEFERIDKLWGDLRFEVSDTGIGIPFEKQGHIFEAFWQADDSITRRYGGSGLGTAIAKQLVEQLGGKIGFRSVAGKGSLFWFVVPVEIAGVPETEVNPVFGTDCVLLVTEELSLAEHVSTILKKHGFQIETSASLSEMIAAQIVSNVKGQPFRAVLVDFDSFDWLLDELTTAFRESGLSLPSNLIGMSRSDSYDVSEGTQLFMLKVPVVERDLVLAINQRCQPNDIFRKDHRILVAEDQRTNRLVLQEYLTSKGYELAFAKDGEEALEMLLTHRYDLAIVDLHMPMMDGLNVISSYQFGCVTCEPIPSIIVTADLTDSVRHACDAIGVAGYFEKPLDLEELSRELERHLDGMSISVDGAADEPYFSEDVVGSLSRSISSTDAFERIVSITISDIDALMDELKGHLGARDAAEARDTLHAVKGAATSVGALKLKQCADLLSKATFSSDLCEVELCADEMQAVWQETRMRFQTSPLFDREYSHERTGSTNYLKSDHFETLREHAVRTPPESNGAQ